MADDLVPPSGDDPKGGLVCEFCECALTRAGEVKRLSPKAKKIRRFEEDAEAAAAALAKVQGELSEVRAQLDAALAKLATVAPVTTAGGPRDWLSD